MYGLDPFLVFGVINVESKFQYGAVSPKEPGHHADPSLCGKIPPPGNRPASIVVCGAFKPEYLDDPFLNYKTWSLLPPWSEEEFSQPHSRPDRV